jgi:hypothetical protein
MNLLLELDLDSDNEVLRGISAHFLIGKSACNLSKNRNKFLLADSEFGDAC